MKIKTQAMPDVVSIERIFTIEEEENESIPSGELDEGTYALDSQGNVWKKVPTATALVSEFTEHDGVKRRRARRA